MTPPVAMTIAASDSSGGAGIQADLRTFPMHGVLGTCALTAVTAPNTRSIRSVHPLPPQLVTAQLDAVLDDLPVVAVKTGALADATLIEHLADRATQLPGLVVDPVLSSWSGEPLCRGAAEHAYRDLLFPHAWVITPNPAEAGALLGWQVCSVEDATSAAQELGRSGASWVVVTGGHLVADRCLTSTLPMSEVVDVLWHEGRTELLRSPRIETKNDHGTGCTLSAAIVARLAIGDEPGQAVRAATIYVRRALASAACWRLGSGPGPLSWEMA
jgi:hydroxymethylpyrimidine/phosphomethylpyrimidine kinase